MKEKKSILFNYITLILIYLIPILSWIFRIPESMRINMGEFRDDPAKYVLTAEMIEKELLHYQIIFYTIIAILVLAFVRFVVLLIKNKKLDLFCLALLVVGVLYLSTFDYSLFSFPEYTKTLFSDFILRSDDNSLHFLSILLLGGVFLLSPILFCVYKVLNPFIFKAFKINKNI